MADVQEKVAEFLGEFAARWSRHDGSELGELFTEDATLINPFGQRADGRAAVGAMYSQFFSGMLGGTTTEFSAITARAVGDDHAFVDCSQVISGGGFQMNGHLSALLRNDNGQWRFADGRPHAYLEPPG